MAVMNSKLNSVGYISANEEATIEPGVWTVLVAIARATQTGRKTAYRLSKRRIQATLNSDEAKRNNHDKAESDAGLFPIDESIPDERWDRQPAQEICVRKIKYYCAWSQCVNDGFWLEGLANRGLECSRTVCFLGDGTTVSEPCGVRART